VRVTSSGNFFEKKIEGPCEPLSSCGSVVILPFLSSVSLFRLKQIFLLPTYTMSSRSRASRTSSSAPAVAVAPAHVPAVAATATTATVATATVATATIVGCGTPPYGDADVVASVATTPATSSSPSATAAVTATPAGPAPLKEYKSFDDMDLPEAVLRGVYGAGFERPSEIQTKAVCVIRDGRDLLAQAQSGTGKTGAFTIGSLCRVDTTKNEVQVVVISPTRELAEQTGTVASLLGQYMGLRVHLATGGTPVDADLSVLGRGSSTVPHFLVVTPGRFYDLLNRKAVQPRTVRVLVMDEADQLLDAKFKEQIQIIMSEPFVWPASTQIVLVSATMIPAIAAIAKSLLVRDPVTILREADEVSLDGIRQFYVAVENESQKLGVLCDLSDCLKIEQATIFVNTQANAEKLAEGMRRRGFDLDCLHGGMDVPERKRRMDAFRAGKTRVLITTDLLARGIDVQQISLVINYDLPHCRENYIHRIGRSGRYGRKGASINLVEPRELRIQAEIEEFYGKTVEPLPGDLNIY